MAQNAARAVNPMQNCWLQLECWNPNDFPIDLSLLLGSSTYFGASRGLQCQTFCIYIYKRGGPYCTILWPFLTPPLPKNNNTDQYNTQVRLYISNHLSSNLKNHLVIKMLSWILQRNLCTSHFSSKQLCPPLPPWHFSKISSALDLLASETLPWNERNTMLCIVHCNVQSLSLVKSQGLQEIL